VTVTFTNVCTEPDGSGATNLIAGVTDQHGDELTSLRPDPGKNMDYPFLAKAHTPYYVDIHDLGDIDLGSGNVCPRAPWSLVVTGPLVANWPSGG
jgi:hypothetical protein